MSFILRYCCCCADEAEHQTKLLKEEEKPINKIEVEQVEDVVLEDTVEDKIEAEEHSLRRNRRKLPKKKKEVERITIVGAVAALPPPTLKELVGDLKDISPTEYKNLPLNDGAYLVYSLDNGGTLYIQYSITVPQSLTGILAYIKPNKKFSNYHYENDNGRIVLSTNIQNYMASKFQNDRKGFYQAWHDFLQLLTSNGGQLYPLKPFDLNPPPKCLLLLYKNNVITPAKTLTPITPDDYDLIGIVPNNFDYKDKLGDNLTKINFINACDKYGCVLEWK